MATNLFSLAGGGGTSAAGTASSIGSGISSLGMPLALASGPLGIGAMALGGLTSLIAAPFVARARQEEGARRFGVAQSDYQRKIASNPTKYSLQGISNIYSRARSDMSQSNAANTNALLDRYNSVQRRQLKNKISSGLTAGAAQAANVQNNIAFQQQANKLFQQQANASSALRLREGQAKYQAQDLIDARKDRLASSTLQSAGITDPTALSGLSSKLTGGY